MMWWKSTLDSISALSPQSDKTARLVHWEERKPCLARRLDLARVAIWWNGHPASNDLLSKCRRRLQKAWVSNISLNHTTETLEVSEKTRSSWVHLIYTYIHVSVVGEERSNSEQLSTTLIAWQFALQDVSSKPGSHLTSNTLFKWGAGIVSIDFEVVDANSRCWGGFDSIEVSQHTSWINFGLHFCDGF